MSEMTTDHWAGERCLECGAPMGYGRDQYSGPRHVDCVEKTGAAKTERWTISFGSTRVGSFEVGS